MISSTADISKMHSTEGTFSYHSITVLLYCLTYIMKTRFGISGWYTLIVAHDLMKHYCAKLSGIMLTQLG